MRLMAAALLVFGLFAWQSRMAPDSPISVSRETLRDGATLSHSDVEAETLQAHADAVEVVLTAKDAERAGAPNAPWQVSWPRELWAKVEAVEWCESTAGQHPDTYRLDLLHGGRLQIAYGTWADFFLREYGWTWEQVVRDDAIHFRAAHIIFVRAGGWSPWPFCGREG